MHHHHISYHLSALPASVSYTRYFKALRRGCGGASSSNGLISSPADADGYVVVDLDRRVVLMGPFRVRAGDYGVSKIAKAVSMVKLMGWIWMD